jgi:hypothetical protein
MNFDPFLPIILILFFLLVETGFSHFSFESGMWLPVAVQRVSCSPINLSINRKKGIAFAVFQRVLQIQTVCYEAAKKIIDSI